MPCATVHMMAAGKVLDSWRESPRAAPPVDFERPENLDWFIHGAMGPDMGYVPGAEKFFSELAHYVSTSRLPRALLRRSQSERQAAFTWGWVTHFLTDVAIHPIVGRRCGELLFGDRSLRLNSAVDIETHVGVEVGLDIAVLLSHGGIPRPADTPVFDLAGIEFVGRALEDSYGVVWSRPDLLATHRKATHLTARWPTVLRLVGSSRAFPGSARGLFRVAAKGMAGVGTLLARRETPTAGFMRPLVPPDWMVDEVLEAMDGLPGAVSAHVSTGLEELEDYNLESGVKDGAGVPHPEANLTRIKLDALRRTSRPGRSVPRESRGRPERHARRPAETPHR